MKFISYLLEEKANYGILHKGKYIIPMENILDGLGYRPPANLLEYIRLYSDGLNNEISKNLDRYMSTSIPLDKVKITAPIPHPRRNVFCLGKNYADHAMEVDSLPNVKPSIPDNPIYFTKLADPAIGPMDTIMVPAEYGNSLDYEVELALIIGKDGRDIPANRAEDHIFGYTVGNDISARDIQTKHSQWFKGKSLDTTTALGPYIVSKSEMNFPLEVDIVCKINDEIRQKSNTKNLIFDIAYIISDLSKGLTLRAGDIILTGTPGGVGAGFKPPKFLKSGDKIESYIEGIGSLINFVN